MAASFAYLKKTDRPGSPGGLGGQQGQGQPQVPVGGHPAGGGAGGPGQPGGGGGVHAVKPRAAQRGAGRLQGLGQQPGGALLVHLLPGQQGGGPVGVPGSRLAAQLPGGGPGRLDGRVVHRVQRGADPPVVQKGQVGGLAGVQRRQGPPQGGGA